MSVSVAFGAWLWCDRFCGSEDSKLCGREDIVDVAGGGKALGLETVYLVDILVVVGRADMRRADCSKND